MKKGYRIYFNAALLFVWIVGGLTQPTFAKSKEDPSSDKTLSAQKQDAVIDAAQLVKKAQMSVVDIQTTGHFKPRYYREPSFLEVFFADFTGMDLYHETKAEFKSGGAGVVIDSSGLILTNAHVVSFFDEIRIRTYDNKSLKALLVSQDIDQDVALLQVQEPYDFKPIEMADISQVKVSDPVYTIGNPLSYSQTVTQGIVSALNRRVDIDPKHPFERMIQTTADVNPGNSGGPLITQTGQMIGIMTISDRRARGINFAISVETIINLLPQLKTPLAQTEDFKNFINRYGFSVVKRKDEVGMNYLSIGDIASSSKAFESGLRTGDVVRQFNKSQVRDLNDLLKTAKTIKPNDTVYVQIERNHKSFFTYIGAK